MIIYCLCEEWNHLIQLTFYFWFSEFLNGNQASGSTPGASVLLGCQAIMFENVLVKGSLRPAYCKWGFEKEYRLLDEKRRRKRTRRRKIPGIGRGGRSFLKIHFFIESTLKMIQFKTKSKIFIQKNIHSIEYRKFNTIIHSKEFEKNHSKLKRRRPKYGFRPSWGPCLG